MEKLEQIVFYSLDKAIKSYRQMAQKNINKENIDITIDQWLLLTTIKNNPDATQQIIAANVFKDLASITRMIEILVKKEILTRDFHPEDRRRFSLNVTTKGEQILTDLEPIIRSNRSKALGGISPEEIETLKTLLNRIVRNCK
ncbi:MarR family winged helix-turn-helix transcriptional regulator [Flavobacterium sp.]|uniref:MarR family winged helix-turn-helix transcriptional regulator n=1 Tax=Flavobacterium sp. TaxID=239 RepID=UPI0039E39BA4